jgi:hypothetical protein
MWVEGVHECIGERSKARDVGDQRGTHDALGQLAPAKAVRKRSAAR